MDAHATGTQVERLLAQLRSGPDPRAAAVAEELVGSLVRLYGAGLARIVPEMEPERLAKLCGDPLVESLLLVHDLHPLDAPTRIRRALERARPSLGAGAELVYRRTDADGVAHVLLRRTGCGCRSSVDSARTAVETAVREAAPEVTGVDVEIAAAPPLLRITRRPGMAP